MAEPNSYRCALEWAGSNKDFNSFRRNHKVSFDEGKPSIEVTAAPEYKGDTTRLNPEELLVAALASCQMLTFLAIASMSKVEVLEYSDRAVGKIEKADGKMKMASVYLRPRIVISEASNRDRAAGLVTKAHEQCFISNSVTTQVVVQPEIEVR